MYLILTISFLAIAVILFVFFKYKKQIINLSLINKEIQEKTKQYNKIKEDNLIAEKELEQLKQSCDYNKTISDQTQENFKEFLSTIKERYELTTESCKNHYDQAKNDYEKEYLQILRESAEDISAKLIEIKDSEITLNNLRTNNHAIINIKKREAEKKEKQDFYKLIISEEEQEDVNYLQTIIPKLHNQEIINKLIWKTYYEKAYTSLMGRIIPHNKQITGIYKITNITNDMPYIGQAVNVRLRFGQHIKRGLKAEPRTNIKLYDAIDKYGLENFTFEIIEECTSERLNEREKYWIDYFESNSYGYNMTKGGSK